MFQPVLVSGYEKDGGGSEHICECARRRTDAADSGWSDTSAHRLAQQGTAQSVLILP